LQALNLVLDRIHLFQPWALVIAVGFDTYGGDPISKFSLSTEDYPIIAQRIKKLNVPTVIVQEGGYNTEALGRNAAAFLQPFAE
ncbi:MAG TPA: histone deacetylase family protein, partial [Anaerolineae bacterium]|nr:histone deacetylase family protein [Anaerolineae bacterium]